MSALISVNEKTTTWITINFKDKAGAPASPDSMVYQIDCLTSGVAIKAPVTVTFPGTSPEVKVDSIDNAIQVPTNQREYRRMTVTAIFGGDVVTDQFDWAINNLSFIT